MWWDVLHFGTPGTRKREGVILFAVDNIDNLWFVFEASHKENYVLLGLGIGYKIM